MGKGKKSTSFYNEDQEDKHMTRQNVAEKFVDDAVAAAQASLQETLTDELNKSIEAMKTSIIQSLMAENRLLAKRVKHLERDLDEVYERLYSVETESYEQQQRSRRENLEVHGIPNEINDEELEGTTIGILNTINNEDRLTSMDIDACHRLPGKGCKPVIIKFTRRKKCDAIFEKGFLLGNDEVKEKLKVFGIDDQKRLYINRNLAPKYRALTYHCRMLKKKGLIFKYTLDNSKLKIKLTEEGRWNRICHEADIAELFPKYKFDD